LQKITYLWFTFNPIFI